ncbi:MAG: hypothetical protein KJ906_02830 [Nanoarchaeota archaeon]|nr:hypothetical protein [Nanoarchaeota archaeon]
MADQVLSHTLYLAIGIIAMLMIVSSVYGMQNNMDTIDKEVKLNYIVSLVENKILELEELGVDEASVKIDGSDYLVKFESNKIIVSNSDIEIIRDVGFEISGEAILPAYLILNSGQFQIIENPEPLGIIPTPPNIGEELR